MARPVKNGGKAAREALELKDSLLSKIVDLMSDELNFRQRYNLRIQVIKYIVYGDRRRSKDRVVQDCFEMIITNYVNPEEIFPKI